MSNYFQTSGIMTYSYEQLWQGGTYTLGISQETVELLKLLHIHTQKQRLIKVSKT